MFPLWMLLDDFSPHFCGEAERILRGFLMLDRHIVADFAARFSHFCGAGKSSMKIFSKTPPSIPDTFLQNGLHNIAPPPQKTHRHENFFLISFVGLLWETPQEPPRIASCFSPWRAREATGAEIPEKWGKTTNSPPRSDPQKWGKITEKLQKLYFRSNFTFFLGQFSPFSGVGPGREIL